MAFMAATLPEFGKELLIARRRGVSGGKDPPGDKRHTPAYDAPVKPFRWSPEKNAVLQEHRGVCFEAVVVAIESGGLLDIVAHPQPRRYPRQRVMVVALGNYVHLVPYVEEADCLFLKTIIPSRKATLDYLKGGKRDVED
jgi:uncharacterized DUF497 family protein